MMVAKYKSVRMDLKGLKLRAFLVAALVCAADCFGDLEMRLRVENSMVMQFEKVLAFIEVTNQGSEAFLIRADDPDVNSRLLFEAEHGLHRAPQRRTDEPLINACLILPGESQELMAEVTQVYDLSTMGGYDIWAAIDWNGVRYFSNREHIDVVSGLPISETVRSVPGVPGSQRRYKLRYLTRESRERLFLVVEDFRTALNYGVFELGTLMRVHSPRITIGPEGNVRVVHQSAPGVFTTSVLTSLDDGVRFVDQSYAGRKVGDRRLDLEDSGDSATSKKEPPSRGFWSWLPFRD